MRDKEIIQQIVAELDGIGKPWLGEALIKIHDAHVRWQAKAFEAHPNIDMDIERLQREEDLSPPPHLLIPNPCSFCKESAKIQELETPSAGKEYLITPQRVSKCLAYGRKGTGNHCKTVGPTRVMAVMSWETRPKPE